MNTEEKLKKFYKLVVVEDEQEDFIYLKSKIDRRDLKFLNIKEETCLKEKYEIALQQIANGEIVGESKNYKDTLIIIRDIAKKAIEKES